MAIISFIIADDHRIFRQGLKAALTDDQELECIGEAGNGLELLEMLKVKKADVIVLDFKMPAMDGFEVLKILKVQYASIKIIVLTMFDDEQHILEMMEAGANGYLLKDANPEEIKDAIHCVCSNGYYFNDLVNTTLLKKVILQTKAAHGGKPEVRLNEREVVVLQLICQELTAVEIGQKIFLSTRTIEGIRSGLLEKIGVRNTAGLVIFALKNGLVA